MYFIARNSVYLAGFDVCNELIAHHKTEFATVNIVFSGSYNYAGAQCTVYRHSIRNAHRNVGTAIHFLLEECRTKTNLRIIFSNNRTGWKTICKHAIFVWSLGHCFLVHFFFVFVQTLTAFRLSYTAGLCNCRRPNRYRFPCPICLFLWFAFLRKKRTTNRRDCSDYTIGVHSKLDRMQFLRTKGHVTMSQSYSTVCLCANNRHKQKVRRGLRWWQKTGTSSILYVHTQTSVGRMTYESMLGRCGMWEYEKIAQNERGPPMAHITIFTLTVHTHLRCGAAQSISPDSSSQTEDTFHNTRIQWEWWGILRARKNKPNMVHSKWIKWMNTHQIDSASTDREAMVMMLAYFGCLAVVVAVPDAFAAIAGASCLAACPLAGH